MSSNSTLTKHSALNTVKKNLDVLKSKSRKIEKDIEHIVTVSTSKEKQAYEKALKRYTDKMNAVLAKDEIKDKLEEKYSCDEKIYDIFTKVKANYQIALSTIMNQPLTDEEKDSKIKRLQNKIQEALVNDEDRKIISIIRKQMKDLPYRNVKMLC
tara:strand:- start:1619 stop:2083 length:465 start_codon:yes stop_codon:yes gene_type:complete